MAAIITRAVARLKDDVQRFLSVPFVWQLACELGLDWKSTPLAVPNLVALFARQILGGNLSMPELARQAGSVFTPEGFCTARGRLPLELLQVMLQRICTTGSQPVAGVPRGYGKATGSGISMEVRFPCPIRRNSQSVLASQARRKRAAVFPWPTSCASSMPPVGSSRKAFSRRCAPTI